VSIEGAVDYPGAYTLKADSTLDDLYRLIGNFKSEAFLEGVVLQRLSVRERQIKAIESSEAALNRSILFSMQQGEDIGDISILTSLAESIEPENLGRIAGNFSPLSQSSKNTILFDGDTVVIPKISNVVNIVGAVLNPIAFEYSDNMRIETAIELAGGYQAYADKRRVYIIKANGLIEKSNRNIFQGNYSLKPGDTVVVPRKINTNSSAIQSLMPIMQILSDLSFSAAALDNLTEN
jgi:protein involved in polysaccharide export with SLBB domain